MKWKLVGQAYGRSFKEEIIPENIQEKVAIFKTKTGEWVIVSVRYVGSVLGSKNVEDKTTCNFTYGSSLRSLAHYDKEKQTVTVFDYS